MKTRISKPGLALLFALVIVLSVDLWRNQLELQWRNERLRRVDAIQAENLKYRQRIEEMLKEISRRLP